MHGVIALAVLRLALRLDLGPEYDTNANRAEIVEGASNPDQPTGSALVRTTTRLQLSWQRGVNLLRVGGGLGAKVFFNPDVLDQDVLVGQLGLDDRVSVARWLDLGAALDYYDAGQLDVVPPCGVDCSTSRRRDFRSGSATARLTFVDGPGDFTLMGGYRGLQYKPDENFDFQAAQGTALTSARFKSGDAEHETEWDLSASYHLERRWFTGPRERNACAPGQPVTVDCIGTYAGQTRDDWYHEATVELSYLRSVLITTSYTAQLNLSSSFGQSLFRHLFTARLAFRLPWELYVTLKAQLYVTSYLDPVLLNQNVATQTFVSIDEENRNAVIVDVERPIGKSGIALDARYSLYTNELASTPVSFLRQTIYLGVTYKTGWAR